MKNFLKWICLAMIVIQPTRLAAEPDRVPEDLRFVFGELPGSNLITDDEIKERSRKLRETPDITNRLFALLWERLPYNYDGDGSILIALGERGDLSEEQLKRITTKMREIASDLPVRQDMEGYAFLCVATNMLGYYPSPEHEDLALDLFSKGDWSLKMAAVKTLGRIGTRKSLEPVRQYVAAQNAKVNPESIAMRDEMIARYGPLKVGPLTQALSNLERRVNTLEQKSSRDTRLEQRDLVFKDQVSSPSDSESSDEQGRFITAIVAGLLLIGVCIRYLLRRWGNRGISVKHKS